MRRPRSPKGLLGRLWRLEVGPDYQRPAVQTPDDFRGLANYLEVLDAQELLYPSEPSWRRPGAISWS